ncbi:LptA/OstA family protein [Sphingomonas sp. SUN039]|uniref:LptA/OstA family protein n=1 Tax=Sphingomonas sp. SUN039 TaxID=2937787 RepID=UPI002164C405|nr:LptA/OstA family protein [Sphingomonas sp. SUN039]UVO55933.1 LptA/OstA family protein [Sphingomonas sp. SUN039]
MSKALLALALLVATPASAQGIKNHNSNAPVDFEADRIEVQDRADRAVLAGNVKVRQGGLALDAARLTVAYTGAITSGNPTVQRLDASGGVVVRSASETASGEFASYDLNRRLITMIGGVTLNQGSNVLRGGRLVIDLASGRSIVDGRSSGGTPGVTGGTGGRVTGRFSVPQRNN